MARLVVDQPEQVQAWVASRIGSRRWGEAQAIGIVNRDGLPIGGVVYHDFRRCIRTDRPLVVQASIAIDSARALTRPVLDALFRYAFVQLDVVRVETTCPADQPKIINFNRRLGFIHEATVPHGIGVDVDGMLWRMLRPECPWLIADDGTTEGDSDGR